MRWNSFFLVLVTLVVVRLQFHHSRDLDHSDCRYAQPSGCSQRPASSASLHMPFIADLQRHVVRAIISHAPEPRLLPPAPRLRASVRHATWLRLHGEAGAQLQRRQEIALPAMLRNDMPPLVLAGRQRLGPCHSDLRPRLARRAAAADLEVRVQRSKWLRPYHWHLLPAASPGARDRHRAASSASPCTSSTAMPTSRSPASLTSNSRPALPTPSTARPAPPRRARPGAAPAAQRSARRTWARLGRIIHDELARQLSGLCGDGRARPAARRGAHGVLCGAPRPAVPWPARRPADRPPARRAPSVPRQRLRRRALGAPRPDVHAERARQCHGLLGAVWEQLCGPSGDLGAALHAPGQPGTQPGLMTAFAARSRGAAPRPAQPCCPRHAWCPPGAS